MFCFHNYLFFDIFLNCSYRGIDGKFMGISMEGFWIFGILSGVFEGIWILGFWGCDLDGVAMGNVVK